MDIIFIVLRLIHILAGIFWVGAAVLMAAFITPAAQAIGPEGGKFMQFLLGKLRLSNAISLSAILTVLAGIALYWRDSVGLQPAWILAPTGFIFTIGAVAGIIAAILGGTVTAPTAARMDALAKEMQSAGGPPKPEQMARLQKLQMRMGQAGVWGAVLLVLSAAAMAIA